MSETTHSEAYEKAKEYYPKLWSAKMLVALVKKTDSQGNPKLTEDEYNEITGFEYPATE